jgi:hypothetical protein
MPRLRLFVVLPLCAAWAIAAPGLDGRASSVAEAAADAYQVQAVCTALPVNIGRKFAVSTGGEFQRALDTAMAGDTILLEAGNVYRPTAPEGSFILRNRSVPVGQWIVVRSANPAFDPGGAQRAGVRASDSNAALMPQIRATEVNAPAIKTEPSASGYRLIGLDIGADASLKQLANLVELGNGSETTVAALPADIVIDRSYLHGNDTGNYRRAVAMNGIRLAVLDSYVSNFHDANGDSQAVGGWNGAGPFKIVNNFLEAASENIMFGGADPAIPNLVPSDIEISRNLSTKRLTWKASGVAVKNAFELKNARRVLVDGNVFEHVWPSGQDGSAILLKSVNQDGNCPWCVTEYVTFRRNIVRSASHGVVINAAETGKAGARLPAAVNHVQIEDVLFEDLDGKLLRIYGGVADLSVTHVTSRSNPYGVLEPRDPADVNPRFVFAYNLVERHMYGIGTGSDEGVTTLSRNFAPYTYRQNVIVNTSGGTDQAMTSSALESRYPPTTWLVQGWNDVGFMPGTSKLAKGSRYARAAEDGRDVGADIDAIAAAQSSSARSGDGCGAVAVPRPRHN